MLVYQRVYSSASLRVGEVIKNLREELYFSNLRALPKTNGFSKTQKGPLFSWQNLLGGGFNSFEKY